MDHSHDQIVRLSTLRDSSLRAGAWSLLLLVATGCELQDVPILADNFNSWPANWRGGSIPGDPVGDSVYVPTIAGGGFVAAANGPYMYVSAADSCAGSCDLEFYAAPLPPPLESRDLEWIFAWDRLTLDDDQTLRIELQRTTSGGTRSPILTFRFTREDGRRITQVIHGSGVTSSGGWPGEEGVRAVFASQGPVLISMDGVRGPSNATPIHSLGTNLVVTVSFERREPADRLTSMLRMYEMFVAY